MAPSLREATVDNYRWALSYHLLPFFAKHRLAQITVAEVDRYRAAKLRAGHLGATSINKTLSRLSQILDVAEERELIARNPIGVNRRRRKLRTPPPRRSYIDRAEQLDALLAAAGQLDREAREDHPTPRRAILATLAFAGLRIGELLELRWRDIGLATGTLSVGRFRRQTPACAMSHCCLCSATSSWRSRLDAIPSSTNSSSARRTARHRARATFANACSTAPLHARTSCSPSARRRPSRRPSHFTRCGEPTPRCSSRWGGPPPR
jgi:site-specific recombinase XerC